MYRYILPWKMHACTHTMTVWMAFNWICSVRCHLVFSVAPVLWAERGAGACQPRWAVVLFHSGSLLLLRVAVILPHSTDILHLAHSLRCAVWLLSSGRRKWRQGWAEESSHRWSDWWRIGWWKAGWIHEWITFHSSPPLLWCFSGFFCDCYSFIQCYLISFSLYSLNHLIVVQLAPAPSPFRPYLSPRSTFLWLALWFSPVFHCFRRRSSWVRGWRRAK